MQAFVAAKSKYRFEGDRRTKIFDAVVRFSFCAHRQFWIRMDFSAQNWRQCWWQIQKDGAKLRVVDVDTTWPIIYRIDSDAIVILDVFSKKTRATQQSAIEPSRKRLREYDDA